MKLFYSLTLLAATNEAWHNTYNKYLMYMVRRILYTMYYVCILALMSIVLSVD